MTHSSKHLSDHQMIIAVVDRADLPPQAARHLEGCRHCRSNIGQLDVELKKMAGLAQEMLPASNRRPLPVPLTSSRLYFRQWPALVASMAAVLMLVGLWLWPSRTPHRPVMENRAIATAFYSLDDILKDEALPEHYQEIIAATHGALSEEFMAYVAGCPHNTPN